MRETESKAHVAKTYVTGNFSSGSHLPHKGDRAVRDDLRATWPHGGGAYGRGQEHEYRRPQRGPDQPEGRTAGLCFKQYTGVKRSRQ